MTYLYTYPKNTNNKKNTIFYYFGENPFFLKWTKIRWGFLSPLVAIVGISQHFSVVNEDHGGGLQKGQNHSWLDVTTPEWQPPQILLLKKGVMTINHAVLSLWAELSQTNMVMMKAYPRPINGIPFHWFWLLTKIHPYCRFWSLLVWKIC